MIEVIGPHGQGVARIFILCILLKLVLEMYLDARNRKYILKHKDEVPEPFKDKISLADHQKAADYANEKIKLGDGIKLYNLLILFIWTLGGGIQFLDHALIGFQSSLTRGVLFFTIFMLISTFLQLPVSIYNTFFLEEKFGFNKTTPKLFVVDLIKSLVLGAIIAIPLIACILWIFQKMGPMWWLYTWIAITGFQLVMMYIFPTFIAPLFNKFTPLADGEVKEEVEGLLKRTSFSHSGLFVMDASRRSGHGNAYFTGLGKSKRIVFFDTLLESLAPKEIIAVLAHELGHFKHKHILKGMIMSFIMSLVGFAILGYLFTRPTFFNGHGIQVLTPHSGLLIFMLVSPVYTFFLTPIFSWFSRKNEFEADDFASEYADASDLINALVKLYKDNASTITPDPVYSKFYHSHPPAMIRVANLEKLKTN